MILKCETCKKALNSVGKYLTHMKIYHRLDRGIHNFACPFRNCNVHKKTLNSLRLHIYSGHKQLQCSQQQTHGKSTFACTNAMCTSTFELPEKFEDHLRSHLKANEKIVCPYVKCGGKEFVKSNAFYSHKSRYHRNESLEPVKYQESSHEFSVADNVSMVGENEISDDIEFDLAEDEIKDFPSESLIQITNFFLKLEAEKLVPLNTIQIVASELQNLIAIFHKVFLIKIEQELKSADDWPNDKLKLISLIVRICDENDMLHNTLCKKSVDDLVSFDTIHSRNKAIEKYYDIIYPEEHILGINKGSGKPEKMHYVSIESSLKKLLDNETFFNLVMDQQSTCCEIPINSVCDYKCGNAYKSNFEVTGEKYLDILLYQDEAEISNPLGSAKGKHKITGTYFTIGNISPELRSRLESIFLISLCKSKHIKMFGIDKCIVKFVEELRHLAKSGIYVHGTIFYPRLILCLGDNLGSNCIGGFTTNFSHSKSKFCRYCDVSLREFKDNPLKIKNLRSANDYEIAVTEIDKRKLDLNFKKIQLKKMKAKKVLPSQKKMFVKRKKKIAKDIALLKKSLIVNGIKSRSLLNKLDNFHVCGPSLPPCIAHDLLEGVVSYDLTLIMKNLILTKKWFTLDEFNTKLLQFQFQAGNICRPVPLKDTFKNLGGSASQNWAFLRYLSVIIAKSIKNPDDDIWTMYIILKEIVEICFAPKISTDQVVLLRETIGEYIELRMKCFDTVPLRPKHHFLTHYPELILQFGPLVRLWTLRFESKHSYFKNVARMCKNFRNITKTLSEKHQKLFSYSLGSNFLKCRTYWSNCKRLNIGRYKSSDVLELLSQARFDGANEALKVVINSIEYRVDDWLILKKNSVDESQKIMGKVKLFIIDKNNAIVILVSVFIGQRDLKFGTLSIKKNFFQEDIQLIDPQSLLDYYPLDAYTIMDQTHVVLRHAPF